MLIRLRQWREARGLSVRALATKAEVSFTTVSRIENGHISPTVDMLEALAKALDIQARDFFPPARRTGSRTSERRRP